MKQKLAIAFFSAAIFFAPQAFATGMFQPDGVSPVDPQGEAQQSQQKVQLPPDPEGRAENLRLQGKCLDALPILRTLEARSHDDITQFNLGQCLLDLSTAERDSARAASLKREGAAWVLKAANDGLPNAQFSLVSVYLDGAGVPRDPIEAGKWSLIYHSNGTRLAIGMHDISSDLQARLDSVLTDHSWAQAQSRADEWTPNAPKVDD